MCSRFFLLLLLAVGLAGCGGAPETPVAPTVTPIPTAPALARPTYLVQRGDVQEILTFTGRWQPRDQMALTFEIGGAVRRVNVRRGDTVTAGQLLADLQIDDLEAQLTSAELALETARAQLNAGESGDLDAVSSAQIALANAHLALESARNNRPWTGLENARIGLDRAREDIANAQRVYDDALSHPEEAASVVDGAYQALQDARGGLRSAETSYYAAAQSYNDHEYRIAEAENAVIAAELALAQARSGASDPSGAQAVTAAQLQVDQMRAEIARSSLYAPIDAEVLDVQIQPGDAAEAYKTVIVIGRSEPKEVIADLAVTDAARLSVGMVGACQLVNQPDTAAGCAVRRIPLNAQEADTTTRIAASFEGVLTDQLIEVDMPLQVRTDVLWLPPAAIRTFQNRTFVVLQTTDGPRAVDVQLGLQTDERVEIVAGVNEGDVVIGP